MRKCVKCNDSEHMVEVVDKVYNITNTRHRVCFRCEPVLKDTDETYLYCLDPYEDEQEEIA